MWLKSGTNGKVSIFHFVSHPKPLQLAIKVLVNWKRFFQNASKFCQCRQNRFSSPENSTINGTMRINDILINDIFACWLTYGAKPNLEFNSHFS